MKNKYIEEYAKLRETVDFFDYNSKNSALDVSMYGSFMESSWLDNRKLYGTTSIPTWVLDEILLLYYYCNGETKKDFVSIVVGSEGAAYLVRVNENNLDKSGRLCPFIEIIHITCEEEMYNAYDIFRTTDVIPHAYKDSNGMKEIVTTSYKLPYKRGETHFLLKNFLYVNLETNEVKVYGDTSFGINSINKENKQIYIDSVNKLKRKL